MHSSTSSIYDQLHMPSQDPDHIIYHKLDNALCGDNSQKMAALCEQASITQLSDIYIRYTGDHQPLLTAAILKKASRCAEYLLEHTDCDPNSNYYEFRFRVNTYISIKAGDALTLAIDNDLTDLALRLIEKGTELNTRYGEKNVTPLMLAVQHNNYPVTKKLLSCGAHTYHKNSNGNTAIQLMTHATHPDIKNLFINRNTNRGRLAALVQHDRVDDLLICSISKEIMDDPISWHGLIFCRESFKRLNSRYDHNHKVGPSGEHITKEKYEHILSLPTVTKLQDRINQFVYEQEPIQSLTMSSNQNTACHR